MVHFTCSALIDPYIICCPSTASWHTRTFNGPLSGAARVSRYQKGKTNLDFTEARDSEWQWHQLGHMQVCTSLHASTLPLSFYKPILLPSQQLQSTDWYNYMLWKLQLIWVALWLRMEIQISKTSRLGILCRQVSMTYHLLFQVPFTALLICIFLVLKNTVLFECLSSWNDWLWEACDSWKFMDFHFEFIFILCVFCSTFTLDWVTG